MSVHLIFPNTLFESIESKNYIIVEEPEYFRQNTNKVKLAYMRACMKFYEDYLRSKGFKVTYINFNKVGSYAFLRKYDAITCYDPVDYNLIGKYKNLGIELHIIRDTPMFMGTHELLEAYCKNNKNISNAHFFNFMKSRLHILEGIKSYDKENRKALPPNTNFDRVRYSCKYHDDAVKYISKHTVFKNNIGDLSSVAMYPVTFEQAENHLQYFLEYRLTHFGDYQDAIDFDEVMLYHSSLSCVLNNGLITPHHVVKEVLRYKDKVSMNNIEGFIRQILGWREFMCFIYKYYYDELIVANHWNSMRRIANWKPWYEGKTGIDSLDHEIKKCVKYAYSNHIIRLMMFLNIFVLCEIHPHDIVEWFMNVCAIDAYPWVMWSNIIAMGWFSPRFMKKPYVSTERYILKMSNRSLKQESMVWKALFYNFLIKKKNRLVGTSRIYLRNLASVEKNTNLQKEYQETANKYLNTL